MVINDRYRFVFVHVPKTGGSSMMRALRGLWGNNRRWVRRGTKHEMLWQLRQHWPARQRLFDRWLGRRLDDYAAFAFVRHPWDRIASLYRYLAEHRPRPEIDTVHSLADFIAQAADNVSWIRGLYSMQLQLDFLRATENGPIDLPFVGHFEHLAEDFATAMHKVGIGPLELPHRNRSTNSGHDSRREFTSSMIDTVAAMFQPDIDAFGYVFDERRPRRRVSGPLQLEAQTGLTHRTQAA